MSLKKNSLGINKDPKDTTVVVAMSGGVDSSTVAGMIKKEGFNVAITSDSCLTGTDRVAEASLEINADIFINVQGDEPLIDPNDIKKSIILKKQYPNHVINCMSKLHKDEDPSDKKIPKVICDLDKNLLYCT